MTDLVDPLGAAAPQQNDSTVDISDQPGAQQLPDGGLLSGDGDPALEGVPESYSFDMPADSGLEMTEEIQAALNEFNPMAKEMGLTQDQYQRLVEFDLKRAVEAEQRSVDEWVGRVKGWLSTAQADQEIGGANYPEARKYANATLRKFGTPALSAFLQNPSDKNPEGFALASHPEIFRLLARVGKAMGDPQPVDQTQTTSPTVNSRDRLASLYPTAQQGGR
jgi:hypothetical protein